MFNKLLENFDEEERGYFIKGLKGVGVLILSIYLTIILFWVIRFIKIALFKGLIIATGVFLIIFCIIALIYVINQFIEAFDAY